MRNEKKIMIIDDDQDDRFFFREALTEILSSAVCVEANDGIDALNQLRKVEQLPDFIFLDINMPRMNGKECLSELKKDVKLKNIPVIMYSTSVSPECIKELKALGSSSYLSKPTDLNKLPEQILAAITSQLKLQ